MSTNTRRDVRLRKMYCILLSIICFCMLGSYMIMSIVPSPNAQFIERSDMDHLKVAADIATDASKQQYDTKDTETDIRPPIRTINNNLLMMPRCDPPHQNTSSWRYYNALVDTNLDTVAKAINLTDNPTITTQQKQDNNNNNSSNTVVGYSKYIPHRLIFTHKENLFNCSISASNTTTPQLFTLAENAKATVNAYSKIWSDLEVVFLTDQDCLDALNEVEPDLIPFFHKEIGMFKADICRVAYLYLYGGYYFDVDVLVVRPFLAGDAKFVTVKGIGYHSNGFFQAFLASEKQNSIVGRSIQIMLQTLQGKRSRGRLFGPTALLQAWKEEGISLDENNGTIYDNVGAYLLMEGNANTLKREYSKISTVLRRNKHALSQKVPTVPDNECEFSGGLCNFVVIDGADETLYFYSRILGTELCGKMLHCKYQAAKEHSNAPPCEPSLDGKGCYWWPKRGADSWKLDCEYSSDWPKQAKDTHNLFEDYNTCCNKDGGPSRCTG
mmetsp:Transcript_10091/g.15148  ORF Transcript_10091/g.15148 Transcript_10091/m.15148 type:complete len:497 (+) Transcript_10091:52-1542(+)